PFEPALAACGVTVGTVNGFLPQNAALALAAAALAFLAPNSFEIMRAAHPVWRPRWSAPCLSLRLERRSWQIAGGALAGAAAALGVLFISQEAPFLYWNF